MICFLLLATLIADSSAQQWKTVSLKNGKKGSYMANCGVDASQVSLLKPSASLNTQDLNSCLNFCSGRNANSLIVGSSGCLCFIKNLTDMKAYFTTAPLIGASKSSYPSYCGSVQ